MKIQPLMCTGYYPKKITAKRNNILNFNQNSSNQVGDYNISTYTARMTDKLKLDVVNQFFVNGISKVDTDTKREHKPISIADIGCCDGALFNTLAQYLPKDTKYFGLDLSKESIAKANEQNSNLHKLDAQYTVGNAFGMPYEKESMDVIILSSIMHELYSYESEEYGEKPYSKESIYHFMEQAYKILKPGGVLIIKDPATPHIDAYEKIKISDINKTDGELPTIEDKKELKNADITKLSTYDKLRRFEMDFYPANNQIEWDENGDCIMPRWLVTEWVRHRKWLATPENWAYEIKENYGTLTPNELAKFATNIGFGVVRLENVSINNNVNIYRINDNEFKIKDMNDNELSLEDFPMFIEAYLRKPRNY